MWDDPGMEILLEVMNQADYTENQYQTNQIDISGLGGKVLETLFSGDQEESKQNAVMTWEVCEEDTD